MSCDCTVMSESEWRQAARAAQSDRSSLRPDRVSVLQNVGNILFLKRYISERRRGGAHSGGGTRKEESREDEFLNEEEERLRELFEESRDYVRESLRLCVEMGQHRRLRRLVAVARSVLGPEKKHFWRRTFAALMERAVERGAEKVLRELLRCAHEPTASPLLQTKPINCQGLINACLNEDESLIKVFVEAGYLLVFDFQKCKKESGFSLEALPFTHAEDPGPAVEEVDGEDENCGLCDNVPYLQILCAMSKPCYILTCYSIASKERMSKINKHCDLPNCDCRPNQAINRRTPAIRAQQQQQEVAFHFSEDHRCPDSKDYRPCLGCRDHTACNEPLLWCLCLAKAAFSCAEKWPEYHQEYKEVATTCSDLAVDLLDVCQDAGEVDLMLQNDAGSSFFFDKKLYQVQGYVRLQMAIYNNDKAFVSQKYCQQILRGLWYGSVPWQEKSDIFCLLYVAVQFILMPWWAVLFIIRQTIQDLKLSESHMKKLGKDSMARYIMKDGNNMDEPLNRFINFSITYLAFAIFVTLCVFNPLIYPDELRDNFQWYHIVLLILTISMILQDLYSLRTSLPNIRGTTFWFWKIYDFLVELNLVGAFTVRKIMGGQHPCPDGECDKETLEDRLPYDTLSNCFFAVASIMSWTRCLYWLQLHDRMGPIIIQLSRVIIDVIAFIFVLVVLLLSFTMALVPLQAINTRCDNYTDYFASDFDENFNDVSARVNIQPMEEGECWYEWNTTIFVTIFWSMIGLVFWGILNPEYPDSAFSTETPEGLFAIAIYAIYCVIAIIVLLNLLVAIMNNTIQRVHDRKNTYWKFVRTTIWVEYFGETYQ